MNILFIVPYVPDLIRVRPFNLIRQMHLRGHHLTVLTVLANPAEKQLLPPLEAICTRVEAVHLPRWRTLINLLQALPTRSPLQASYSWHPALANRAADLIAGQPGLSRFDVVHVEHLRGARYGLAVKNHPKLVRSRPPVVWDSVDNISYLFRQAATGSRNRLSQWITRFELARTERYEAWLAQQFEQVLVTSAADQKAFAALLASQGSSTSSNSTPANLSVVRNGVDSVYYAPDGLKEREPATLVVSGKMSYHANVTMVMHLVEDILPLVWSKRPDVHLWIVGKNPTRSITNLAADPRIQVTGTVADIRPYLRQATLAVAPVTYGAGIQNKALEAMACEAPLVASPQAVSALDAVPDRDLLVGQTPQDFAQAILSLLSDPQKRLAIGTQGRRYVTQNHQWSLAASQLEKIYTQAIEASLIQAQSLSDSFSLYAG